MTVGRSWVQAGRQTEDTPQDATRAGPSPESQPLPDVHLGPANHPGEQALPREQIRD